MHALRDVSLLSRRRQFADFPVDAVVADALAVLIATPSLISVSLSPWAAIGLLLIPVTFP